MCGVFNNKLPEWWNSVGILGVKRMDRTRNIILRSKTCTADVEKRAAKLKCDWERHIYSMRPQRWDSHSRWMPENDHKADQEKMAG